MSAEEGTIHCLLCRGIVTFSEKNDARYKDHLKVEHRVYFCSSWIIEKTRNENQDESTDNTSEFNNNNEVKEEIDNDEGDNLNQYELAANLAKIKETLTQSGVKMGQASHFLNQSNAFGDDEKEPEVMGKCSFLYIPVKMENPSPTAATSHKSFDSKSRGEQHLKTDIPLHQRKRFQCPQCKDRFITAKSLERHIKLALCQGIKIYSCTVCKKQFDNKFDLGDHKKSTHQQFRSKHNCETCGEGFRKREALERHVRRHTGEKPFSCEICQKAFKTSSYVKTHKKTQHNIDEVVSPTKTVPQHEEMGTSLLLNRLTGEEPLGEEEYSEENVNGQAMNDQYLENGVHGYEAMNDHTGND